MAASDQKHLLDCYVTTCGIDFIEIAFLTLSNVPHKAELKPFDASDQKSNENDDGDDCNEQKEENDCTQTQILNACKESTKDSQYPFKQTVYFWHCKFTKLQAEQPYTFHLSCNQHNNGFEPIHSCTVHTLKSPKGKFLFRFGILADAHINCNYVNKRSYGKRLYHAANDLCSKYINKIATEHHADFVVFPGDIVDCGSKSELDAAKRIILENKAKIKCYPIIGNHESYSTGSPRLFYDTFNLGQNGFYSFDYQHKFHFIMICAPDQDDLNDDTLQYEWLCNELEQHKDKICFIFTHYSFVLHPCVSGYKNDGMQQFGNHRNLLRLFKKYRQSLRVVFAGHKNVPSVVVQEGISHLLCPQLIQSPCGYDVVDVYEDGLVKHTFEMDEKCLVYQSRVNCGEADWTERFGTAQDRCFSFNF